MSKDLMDKFMCVSRKTAKAYSCKSKIEGVILGTVVGMVSGVAVGMLLNTRQVKQFAEKMVKNFPGNCKEE